MAAIGKQLKQSVKVFHSLMLYLLLPREIFQYTSAHFEFKIENYKAIMKTDQEKKPVSISNQ